MEEEAQYHQETEASSSSTMDPPPQYPSPPKKLEEVKDILRYSFNDKNLLEEAFTHASDLSEADGDIKRLSFERLAYLGDAVLNLLVTKEHFYKYQDLSSGRLTRLRAANVDTEKLARVAVEHGLDSYLRHKKPLLDEQRINEFKKEIKDFPTHSNGLTDAPKGLADLVESIIGAIFIDSQFNVDIVWQVFKPLLEPMINAETLKTHPVTQLNELCNRHNLKYEFGGSWEESKEVTVLVDGQLVGRGACNSKKEIAQNRAAQSALTYIQTNWRLKDVNFT